MIQDMQELKELYIKTFSREPKTVEQLKGAGSNRQYYRFCDADGNSVIGAVGTSVEENDAFIYLSRHFRHHQLPVPEVYTVSEDRLRYLLQDLGSRSLFDAIAGGRDSGGRYNLEEQQLLEKTIRELPRLQIKGAEGLEWNVCYPQPAFDKQNVFFDLNYFKYCFLKATELDFNEIRLEADFRLLAKDLTENVCAPVSEASASDSLHLVGKSDGGSQSLLSQREPEGVFMYRDFQARNIMLDREGNPLFIDFQGGRRGPCYYDLASFLWQASAKYSHKLRRRLVKVYYEALKQYTEVPNIRTFVNRLSLFVLFRTIQVLGAYGFRGYFEKKEHFIKSIPPAMQNLRELLSDIKFPYPYLVDVLTRLTQLPQFAPEDNSKQLADGVPTPTSGKGPLTVRIFSFSFKKGIPEDPSGNGGGYVFDCRSTHNPGRYEPYKKITGLHEPVIRFLEDDGEILTFLDSVYKLADAHIERYIQRGFTSLMFCFGCTGGQHRSVYSAQHLADRIRKKYPMVNVELTHREQERPRALIFAAGLGTRLKPLTDTMPKALVPVCGKTLLQRTIETLKATGIDHMAVNVHHFSDQIMNFLKENKFGVDIQISDETYKLLDTGGGLLKARSQFNGIAPILIHNVDIISNADLNGLMADSAANEAVATLLVSQRETSRYLLFDEDNNLVGWKNLKTGELKGPAAEIIAKNSEAEKKYKMFAFSGIHIVKQSIFPLLEEYAEMLKAETDNEDKTEAKKNNANAESVNAKSGNSEEVKYGIIDFYLWACSRAKVKCMLQTDLNLTDVGKLDTLNNININ